MVHPSVFSRYTLLFGANRRQTAIDMAPSVTSGNGKIKKKRYEVLVRSKCMKICSDVDRVCTMHYAMFFCLCMMIYLATSPDGDYVENDVEAFPICLLYLFSFCAGGFLHLFESNLLL
eukprot:GEMP01091180.1.p1 GENE.GEMP01091180.1~~GEMP01091180.1.p1  ORF type:complete len:118 (+),score=10.64 GEMP01091180.1:343-696(+)